MQVPDETTALVNLARQGLVVAAGSTSFVTPPGGLLRVSVLQLPELSRGLIYCDVHRRVVAADYVSFSSRIPETPWCSSARSYSDSCAVSGWAFLWPRQARQPRCAANAPMTAVTHQTAIAV